MTLSCKRGSMASMGRRPDDVTLGLLACVAMVLLATPAGAQKTKPSEAETLFNTARDLMAQQRFADACPMLSRSDQLMPAVGTALNLGLCSERVGRTASAILAYKEAISLAEQMGTEEKKRLQLAHDRVAALEPRLVRLKLAVSPDNPPSLQIKRDGIAIDRSQWTAAVPVDPEDHLIEASAPGKVAWQTTINASTEGGSVLVTVPLLIDMQTASTLAVANGPAEAAPQSSHTGRILGELGLLVLGVGALAAGGVLALGAKSEYDDGQSLCNTSGCPTQTESIDHSAVVRGDVATVMMGVGGAALVGAGVLWILTPSSKITTGSAVRGLSVGWSPMGVLGMGFVARGEL
jgi:hypothetical protein